jgi:hypothetical protein
LAEVLGLSAGDKTVVGRAFPEETVVVPVVVAVATVLLFEQFTKTVMAAIPNRRMKYLRIEKIINCPAQRKIINNEIRLSEKISSSLLLFKYRNF